MAAGQLDRDTRLMIAVLVALNALAAAAVFDLGGVLRILASQPVGRAVAAAMNGGSGRPQRSSLKAWRRLFVATGESMTGRPARAPGALRDQARHRGRRPYARRGRALSQPARDSQIGMPIASATSTRLATRLTQPPR